MILGYGMFDSSDVDFIATAGDFVYSARCYQASCILANLG